MLGQVARREVGRSMIRLCWGGQEERRGRREKGGVVMGRRVTVVGWVEVWVSLWREGLVG